MLSNQPMPDMPARIAKLPRDHRGFPIPWFVAELEDGTRDFRVASAEKKKNAVIQRRCWVCGDHLGRHLAFVIGPMCVVNRVTSEPPCHLECATFSATACPFLTRPRMRRNDKDIPEAAVDAPGLSIPRNPGVACVYVSQTFRVFNVPGGWLIRLGEPESVLWFAHGVPATRDAVQESIDSGYPTLLNVAEDEGRAAVKELQRQRALAMKLLPAE